MHTDLEDVVEDAIAAVAGAADGGFSGVVRVDVAGRVVHESAHGAADRAHGIALTPDTRIGIASGAKGFTASAVVAQIERGALTFDTTARSLLGADLPLVDHAVTVEHLLSHRSGIGDYLDESVLGDITDHVMPVPVHRLQDPESYLEVLDGHPTVFPPGERFAYNNGGYVLLALLLERATGRSYHDLVDECVCTPAGMERTAFLRSDELPGDAAIGYLHAEGLRTNVLHLPVRGVGDGGIHTTAGDMSRFWRALFDGRIVSREHLELMLRPHGAEEDGSTYGLGFWLSRDTDAVMLEGSDAGASFRSVHEPSRQLTWSVLSNTSEGAWPMVRALREALAGATLP